LNNPEYAPPGSYLRFTGNDDYALKTAFIGELSVKRVTDNSGNTTDITVDFYTSNDGNISSFVEQLKTCVDKYQESINSVVQNTLQSNAIGYSSTGGINSLNINCEIQMPVSGNSSTISFDAGNAIIKPVLSSLVNYYFYVSQGIPLDSTSAKWINFIATIDSGIIRAIKVAALAGGSGDTNNVVTYLGNIISTDLLRLIASKYALSLVTEGCSEMQTAFTALSRELEHIIPATNTDSNSAGSKPLLDGIREKVRDKETSVMQMCSAKVALAGQNLYNNKSEVYTKNRESLVNLAKSLEEKLVQNLNSRGLGTLAKYVRVES
jgi:hypothetical protein